MEDSVDGTGEPVVTFINGVEETWVIDGHPLSALCVLSPVVSVGSEPKDSQDVWFVEVDENLDLEERVGVLLLEIRNVLYELVGLLDTFDGVAGVETMDENVPVTV